MDETTVTDVTKAPLCSYIVTKDYDPWFSDDEAEKAYARGVCRMCPMLADCAVTSLFNNFEYGIFAAMDPETRIPLREQVFKGLPANVVVGLVDKYQVTQYDEPPTKTASIEAKHARRLKRAQKCYELMRDRDDVPQQFYGVVVAVLDSPNDSGEMLGEKLGVSTATFNHRLRACFEFFGFDLAVI